MNTEERDYLALCVKDTIVRRSNVFNLYKHFDFMFNQYRPCLFDNIFHAEFLTCQGFLSRILLCLDMCEYVVVALFIQEFLSRCEQLNLFDCLCCYDFNASVSPLSKLFFYSSEFYGDCDTVHDVYTKVLKRAFQKCFVGDFKLFKDRVYSSRKPLKYFFLNPASYEKFKSLYYSDLEVSHYKTIIRRYVNEGLAGFSQ